MSDPLGPMRPSVGIRQVRSDGVALEPATVLDIVGIPVTRDIGADGIPKYTLTISGVDFATVAAALAAADAPLDFNGQKLSNIAVPDANTDAATKLYVDTAAGAKVSSVGASLPLVSTGGLTPSLSINAATTSLPGSMSAADKTKLDAAASAATVSTLILRDSNGRAKVADPNTDDDIDTRGARNTAIATVTSSITLVDNGFAFSPPLIAATGSAVRVTPGASRTHGISFYVTRACNCIGALGYWVNSGTETVRLELWANGGASLANGSLAVSAAGLVSITWGSPIALTPYSLYHVTQCVAGSGAITTYNATPTALGINVPTAPFSAGHGLFINSLSRENNTANTFPNGGGAGFYPVAPRIG